MRASVCCPTNRLRRAGKAARERICGSGSVRAQQCGHSSSPHLREVELRHLQRRDVTVRASRQPVGSLDGQKSLRSKHVSCTVRDAAAQEGSHLARQHRLPPGQRRGATEAIHHRAPFSSEEPLPAALTPWCALPSGFTGTEKRGGACLLIKRTNVFESTQHRPFARNPQILKQIHALHVARNTLTSRTGGPPPCRVRGPPARSSSPRQWWGACAQVARAA